MAAPTLLLATLVLAASGGSPTVERRVDAEAHDLRTGRLLYLEQHREQWRGGRLLLSHVTDRRPDGRPMSEKWLVARDTPWAPGFETLDLARDRREAALPLGTEIELAQQAGASGAQLRERTRLDPHVVVDAGLYPFVAAHWDRLLAGDSLSLAIPVPSRLALYEFRLRRLAPPPGPEGAAATTVTFELTAASFLVRLALDPIRLTYSLAERRLLEQSGRTGLADDNGRPIVARVVYLNGTPGVAPAPSAPESGTAAPR